MTDDFITGVLPIGFQFCFFGNTYTQFYIGSNGWIGFTPGQPIAFTATAIPNVGAFVPKNCIMGPWNDLNPGFGTGPYVRYQTQGLAPFRRLVVQWTNCPLYQCTSTTSTFQIVIFESTNIIEHHITNKPTCMAWAGGTATQGLHNQTGTVAVTVPGRNASVWTAVNDSKRFVPSGPPNYTVNWTSNGFPIGAGNAITTTISSCPATTRIIGRVNFQCSNLILYDTLDVACGGTASAAFSIPSTVCAGQPASFTYFGGSAGTGTWTFGSGAPNTATGLGTQSTTWSTAGTYPVTLTVSPSSGTCLPGTLTQNITITAPPTATFTVPATLCTNTGGTITYTGTAPAGSSYAWNFGTGATPSTATGVGPHTVTYSSTGSKTITLTVTSGTCTATSSNIVTVSTSPTSTFTVSTPTICALVNNTFSFTGTAPVGATYNWNFGAGATPASATTAGPHSVIWSTAGSKNITLQVSAGGCTSNVTTQTVVVNSLPASTFTLPASVCVGANAAVTYTGGAPAPPLATYTWNINGGTPAVGNVQGPLVVSWATPGIKTVTLSVAQSGCVSTTTSNTITVNPSPTVAIAASAPTVCVNQAATFNISGTPPAAGSAYLWSFPGGTPTSATTAGPVTTTWSVSGSQTASLVVTTAGCSSSPAIASVTVTSPPPTAITIPAQACMNTPVTISAAGPFTTGTTFNWNFGSGTVLSGSGAGPYSVQWASSGNQTVTLTAAVGTCSSTSTATINIKTGALVTFTLPVSTCVNQSNTISFTGTASGTATYAWNFGAGASPATANTIGPHVVTWSTAGAKTVTLNVTDNGCVAPAVTQNITVNGTYTSTFSLPATICAGTSSTVTYTGNSIAGATYAWNFGAGASPATASTAGPHNVIWSNAGTSTVSLTVGSGTCSATTTNAATITASPAANFTAAASIGTGVSIPITFTGTALAGATYSWNFGAGASPAAANSVGPHNVSWSTSGSKTLTLTVTQNGCTSTISQPITILTAATATFTADTAICASASANITYTGNAGIGATYAWNFDGGTASPGTGVGPHIVTWPTAGIKNISLVVTQAGISSSPFAASVNVNPIPTSTFTMPATICVGTNAVVTYTGSATAGATYAWNFGAGSSPSTATSQGPHSINFSNPGAASVSLTVTQNGCVSPVTIQTSTVQALPLGSFNLPATGCVGQPVNITYTGSSPTTASYSWNFGTNASLSTATTQGPHAVSWSTPGTATVTLFLTQNSCTATPVSHTIQVNSLPSSAFILSTPECVNEHVTATYTGTPQAGATYNWSYPGATLVSGNGQGPLQIAYSAAGSQTATLSVTANGCTSASTTQTTDILAPPSFTITSPSHAGINLPVTVTYTGTQPSGTTYSWNFNGATVISGTGSGPFIVQWPTTGIKNISCTATLNGCNPITQASSTEVVGAPVNSFTVQSPVCVNQPSTIVFDGIALGSAAYSWDFDGGTIFSGTGPGPFSVSWPTAGSKNVTLVVTQMGISATLIQVVTVNAIPTSTFTMPSFTCTSDTIEVNYSGNASVSATYNWNFGIGVLTNASASQNNDVVFSTAGNTAVSLTVTENGCTSTFNSQDIEIRTSPIASFSTVNSACEGSTTAVLFTGSVGANPTYDWSFDTGILQSGTGPGPIGIEWSQAGINNISLVVNDNGCYSDTVFESINIIERPTANFIVNTDSCLNNPVLLSYSGNAGATASFDWDYSGATLNFGVDQGPISLQYAASGMQTVSLTVSENSCISHPYSQSFNLNVPPDASFSMNDTIYIIQNATINFEGVVNSSSSFLWDYPGATLVSGTGSGPLVLNYSSAGDYSVSLDVSNNGCNAATVVHNITVLPLPSSLFTTSQDSVCSNSAVAFVYSGIANSQATYYWNFDGGLVESGAGAGPYAVSWNVPGTKTVSLMVSLDNITSSVTTFQIEVIGVPQASFDIVEQVCLGATAIASFTENVGTNYQFIWEIDGAQIINQTDPQNISLAWDSAGVKMVSLSVADAMCISVPISQAVLVNPIPTASFNLPAFACNTANFEVNYTGNASDMAEYNWDFGSGTIISGAGSGPITVQWSTSGNSTVSLVVTENGCASSLLDTTILVRDLPTADAGADKLVCSGDTAIIGISPVSGYTYSWFPANGLSSDTLSNPAISLTSLHNYVETTNYTLTVNDGFCLARDSVSIEIAPMPQAAFNVPAPQCFNGNSFDFSPAGIYNESATFSWNFGPHGYSHSPSEQNQNDVTFDVVGYQTVSLVISQLGCTSEIFIDSVLVNEHPSADYTAFNVKGCVPLTTDFDGFSNAGNNLTFNWNFGDGNTGEGQETSHEYLESGYMTVTLTVTDSNGCSAISTKQNMVQVLEQPIAGFRTSPEIVLIGADELELTSLSQNALHCYYIIEGDTILGCMNSYSFTEEGVYPITQVVINATGCTDEITHTVRVEYGTEYYIPTAFTPNADGTNDVFKVEGQLIKNFNLIIFDRWGNEIFTSNDPSMGWNGYNTDGSFAYPEGVYVFRLEMRSSTNQDIVENGNITLFR
jgi:gliding motility-associated-like protein